MQKFKFYASAFIVMLALCGSLNILGLSNCKGYLSIAQGQKINSLVLIRTMLGDDEGM